MAHRRPLSFLDPFLAEPEPAGGRESAPSRLAERGAGLTLWDDITDPWILLHEPHIPASGVASSSQRKSAVSCDGNAADLRQLACDNTAPTPKSSRISEAGSAADAASDPGADRVAGADGTPGGDRSAAGRVAGPAAPAVGRIARRNQGDARADPRRAGQGEAPGAVAPLDPNPAAEAVAAAELLAWGESIARECGWCPRCLGQKTHAHWPWLPCLACLGTGKAQPDAAP